MKNTMLRIFALLVLALTAGQAVAQFTPGSVLTAAQLNNALAAPNITGGTITGLSAPIPLASGGTNATTATGATSQLQYLQGATGSGARSLVNKLQDTTSVLDFAGCDPTGVLDSTTCIQNAIASFNGATTGGICYVPPGIYKVSSTLNFGDKQNIYLQGAGPNVSVIKPTSAVSSIVQFGNTGTNDQGISDITIDCTNSSACTALTAQDVNTFALQNVSIVNPGIGLYLVNGFAEFFGNLTITGASVAFVKIHGGNDQFFINGVFNNASSGFQPSLAGIWSDENQALWLVNMDVINGGTGLMFAPGNGQIVTWPFIMNSAFDSGTGDGIAFLPTGTGLIKGATLTGNWTSTNSGYGVNIAGTGIVDGVRVLGHRSFNNSKSGYTINNTGTAENIAFDGDDASGNSAGTPSTYSGFDIESNVSGFSIQNSTSKQEAQFGNTQARGIIINPGSSNNYTLIGNDVRGNTLQNIYDGGTGTTKIIKGNLGYNPIASTSITVSASPFTYTNNTGDTVNVFVTGGTVSNVSLGGNTVAASTNTVVPVPQGASVVVTYSSAPTMTYLGY